VHQLELGQGRGALELDLELELGLGYLDASLVVGKKSVG
jgi:hypothetical protein